MIMMKTMVVNLITIVTILKKMKMNADNNDDDAGGLEDHDGLVH